jgi:hypothetical protein
MFTRVYTNLIKPELVKKMHWDDGCLYKFWQEGFVGSMISSEGAFKRLQVIVPNSSFKETAELTTVVSVALGMLLTLWTVWSAPAGSAVGKLKPN